MSKTEPKEAKQKKKPVAPPLRVIKDTRSKPERN